MFVVNAESRIGAAGKAGQYQIGLLSDFPSKNF